MRDKRRLPAYIGTAWALAVFGNVALVMLRPNGVLLNPQWPTLLFSVHTGSVLVCTWCVLRRHPAQQCAERGWRDYHARWRASSWLRPVKRVLLVKHESPVLIPYGGVQEVKTRSLLNMSTLKQKTCKKIWKIRKKCLSLQRQNLCFDYAAECGE